MQKITDLRLIIPVLLLTMVPIFWGCSNDSTAPTVDEPVVTAERAQGLTTTLRAGGPGQIQPAPINKPYNPIDFEDGLIAESSAERGGVRTILTNMDDGSEVAELFWNVNTNEVFVDVYGVVSGTMPAPDSRPNFFGTNVTLYYVYQEVMAAEAGKAGGAEKDEPGCDRIPDWLETTCMRACCAIHDACYAAETPPCTEKSWLFQETLACTLCNAQVVACMLACKPWYVPDWIITRIWEFIQD